MRLAIGKSDLNEIAGLVRWLYGQSIMTELPLIQTPTLFIIGSRDGVVPPLHQLSTARRMPNAAVVIIPEVGHLPMVEAPDAFDRAAAMFSELPVAAAADRSIQARLKRLARMSPGHRRPRQRNRGDRSAGGDFAGRLTLSPRLAPGPAPLVQVPLGAHVVVHLLEAVEHVVGLGARIRLVLALVAHVHLIVALQAVAAHPVLGEIVVGEPVGLLARPACDRRFMI